MIAVIVAVSGISLVATYYMYLFLEATYAEYINQKPFFRHFYFRLRKLNVSSLTILREEFFFYKKLSEKEQLYFEHRVSKFISEHEFLSREDAHVNDRVKVLIGATATMLTFGYRDNHIRTVDKFIIYPDEFYSETNKVFHKGEYNTGYKSIALSWKDVEEGYETFDDNLNLGIHEYVHAMYFAFIRADAYNVSAIIFMKGLKQLKTILNQNEVYKQRLIASNYLRDYAFTNQFEFVSVIIESFIETPNEFRTQFPELYEQVKVMLNFNFEGYRFKP